MYARRSRSTPVAAVRSASWLPYCRSSPDHRNVRNAVLDIFGTVLLVSELGVIIAEVRLGVQHAPAITDDSQRLGDQPAGQPAATAGRRGHHATDPRFAIDVQNPHVRPDFT